MAPPSVPAVLSCSAELLTRRGPSARIAPPGPGAELPVKLQDSIAATGGDRPPMEDVDTAPPPPTAPVTELAVKLARRRSP